MLHIMSPRLLGTWQAFTPKSARIYFLILLMEANRAPFLNSLEKMFTHNGRRGRDGWRCCRIEKTRIIYSTLTNSFICHHIQMFVLAMDMLLSKMWLCLCSMISVYLHRNTKSFTALQATFACGLSAYFKFI